METYQIVFLAVIGSIVYYLIGCATVRSEVFGISIFGDWLQEKTGIKLWAEPSGESHSNNESFWQIAFIIFWWGLLIIMIILLIILLFKIFFIKTFQWGMKGW